MVDRSSVNAKHGANGDHKNFISLSEAEDYCGNHDEADHESD